MPRTRGGILDPFDGLESASGGRKMTRGPGGRNHLEVDEASLDESALDYSKNDFEINEMILARHPERDEAWWPGILLDPKTEVPDHIRRVRQRDKCFCVMFYGPGSQLRTRDFVWVSGDGDLLPLAEYYKKLRDFRHGKGELWIEAIDEVNLIKRGQRNRIAGALDEEFGQGGRGHARQQRVTECVSCECPLDNFEIANTRQLNSRCETCHDRYGRGHFCPVCDKVWLPDEKDMVGCDTCTFWVHASCDRLARKALASADQMDYYCPHCRKVRNFNNRLVALQQAQHAVQSAEPRPPRTAYHIFAQEIHREYNVDSTSHNLGRVVTETWRSLTMDERVPYERAANNDLVKYQREHRAYEEVQRRYSELRAAAEQDGIINESGQPIKIPRMGGHRPHSAASPIVRSTAAVARPGSMRLSLAGSGGSRSLHSQGSTPRQRVTSPARAPSGTKRFKREPSPDYVPQPSKKKRERERGSPQPSVPREVQNPQQPASIPSPLPDLPDEVPIFCNSTSGILLLQRQRVLCSCKDCAARPGGMQEFSCTQFEQHCGAGSAKKWKASLRIPPGGVPEVPLGGASMPVGKWMEIIGLDSKAPGGRREGVIPPPVTRPSNQRLVNQHHLRDHSHRETSIAASTPSPPPEKEKKERVVKKEERDLGPWEPWLEMQKGNFKPLKVRWAGDRCTVCDSDVDFDFDQLVSCDHCGITVHQTCYGVPELPGEDDLWLCRSCEFKEEGKESPQCCLCPVSGGALKKTTEPGLWCHAACMQWIPEVTVEDLNRMEPVSHIKSIQKERWDLNCSVCRQRVGAKIQCSSCYTAYHPLCGRIAGLHMEMVDPEGPNEAVRLVSYCMRHCQPKPHMSGVRLISKEEESKQKVKGDDGNGLWNAQLFPPPALVPVPDCPSGCARMEPIESQGWIRKSHGTGMGHSSSVGYWIPKKPTGIVPQSRVVHSSRKRKGGGTGLGRGRPSTVSRTKIAKPAAQEVLEELAVSDADGDHTMEEVAPASLEPLPEDVPEELPIQCNGRSALLAVRTQRVLYNDQEISASKFEALCGKGDAKKWKCSIWQEDDEGQPVMMMQDWLNKHKLDRKALANLASNLALVEAYEIYVAHEVKATLDGIISSIAEAEEPTAQDAAQTMQAIPALPQSNTAEDPVLIEVDAPVEAMANKSRREDNREMEQPVEAAPDFKPSTHPSPAPIKELRLEGRLANGDETEAGQAVEDPSAAALHLPNGNTGHDNSGESLGGPDLDIRNGEEAQQMVEEAPSECPPPVEHNPTEPITSAPQNGHAHALGDFALNSAAPKTAGDAESANAEKKGTLVRDTQAIPPPAPSLRPSVATADGKIADAVSPPEATGTGPASVVGHHCEVNFTEDSEWYKALVRGYDRATKLHNLWYYYDGEAEWIDLLEEDKSGRVRWDNPKLCANLRVTNLEQKGKPPPIGRDALNGEPAPVADAAVGWRIAVWWKDDACFYKGVIELYSPESGRHKVRYDDAETEYLLLSAEHIRWERRPPGPAGPPVKPETPATALDQLPPPAAVPSDIRPAEPKSADPPTASASTAPQTAALPAAEATAGSGDTPVEDKATEAARLERAAQAPDRVLVVCNAARGTFLTQRGAVQMSNGQTVSPTEFERFAGKAASKKWKASIRIDKGNGAPGITIGDWLVDQGLDAPKAPRIRSGVGAIRQQQRHSVAVRTATAVPVSRGPVPNAIVSKQGHRDSCMCVICKQARRTGKPWSGMVGGPQMLVYMPTASPNAPVSGRQAVTSMARYGKRAYVRCTGQLVRGPIRVQPWQVPKSRLYNPEEWEIALAELQGPDMDDSCLVSQGSGVMDSGIKVEDTADAEPQEPGKPVKEQRKALTLKERLEICQATERQRLSFCKSGIHGWGLFARVEMKQDSMVIEYRGEALRRCMADFRERIYRTKDMDCYLFNINDDVVVDATMKGTVGRFTNHCCSPSMYTKVLEVEGQPHLVFFARQDLRIGQELTYDYRFKEEEGDNKLPCQCGAPNCRGFMN